LGDRDSQVESEDWKRDTTLRTFPDAVATSFRLRSLPELVEDSTASGATRFIVCPAFDAIHAFTLLFCGDDVSLSLATSDGDPWGAHLAENVSPFPPHAIRTRENTISIHQLPKFMRRWENVARFAREAVSCMTATLDGISYYHLAFDGDVDVMHGWFNPSAHEHPRQTRFVNAYSEIERLL